jgi:hypothetical protein
MSNAKLGIKCECGAVAVVQGGNRNKRRCLCRSCGNRFSVEITKPAPKYVGIKAERITIPQYNWNGTRLG